MATVTSEGRESAFSTPVVAYSPVKAVEKPVLVDDGGCMKMMWIEPAQTVFAYEVEFMVGNFSYTLKQNADTPSLCLSFDSFATQLDESSLVILRHATCSARVRALSPAGRSPWSALLAIPARTSQFPPTQQQQEQRKQQQQQQSQAAMLQIVVPLVVLLVVVPVIAVLTFRKFRRPSQPKYLATAMVNFGKFTSTVQPKILSAKSVKFLQQIGEGKFGQVHKGMLRVGSVDAVVALKWLKDGFPEQVKESFATEALIMVKIL